MVDGTPREGIRARKPSATRLPDSSARIPESSSVRAEAVLRAFKAQDLATEKKSTVRVAETLQTFSPEAHYDGLKADLDRLRDEVEFALTGAMKLTGIKIHSVTTRVKDRSSYLDKIKRKAYEDPKEQVQDLVGGRAVCLFITDLPAMRAAVESVFDIISVDDKVQDGPEDTFGYMSVHYICRLKKGTSGPRYVGLTGLTFEIQCRTILMDAWANVSHYLAYKGEASIPKELRKDFAALAGLFYVADKHFELFYESAEASDNAAKQMFKEPESVASGMLATAPLNRSTMLAYLDARFPDRLKAGSSPTSALVEEVSALGVSTIGEFDSLVGPYWDAAEAYEKEHPPSRDDEWEESDDDAPPEDVPIFIRRRRRYEDDASRDEPLQYADVGIARMALAIASPTYASEKYPMSVPDFAKARKKANASRK